MRARAIASLVVGAFVLAACGDDDVAPMSTVDAGPRPPAPTPAPTPPGVPPTPPGTPPTPIPPGTPPPASTFTGCAGDSAQHAVFDSYWSTFDTSYALFDLRLPGRSWGDVGATYCARISATMTDAELYDVLLAMARELDDGHIQLEAESLGREDDGEVTVYPYDDLVEELEGNVEETYLDEDELTWGAEEWFGWGHIGDIGYISITAFEELDATGDGEEEPDRAAGRAAIAQAIRDLSGVRAMIVDIRANAGGWDSVALDVATWFAGPRTIAWSEQRRSGPGHLEFGPWEDTYVEAAQPDAYAGPVILLQSGSTFSAGETFALAMRVRSNVTVWGEPTAGHFSDMMDAELPNGWSYTLSFERYRAADGQVYETRGVPVAMPVAFDATAFASGQDVMLEAVLASLGAPTP